MKTIFFNSMTLFILMVFVASGCSLTEEMKRRSPKKAKNNAAVKTSDGCFKIKDGKVLDKKENETYKNVGFVLLLDDDRGLESICTGYLIKPDVVLTAQHCISDTNQIPRDPSKVIFTFTDLKTISEQSKAGKKWPRKDVKKIIQWAEDSEEYRDAALLQLTERFDVGYQGFDLLQKPLPSVNSEIVMVGYGNYVKQGSAEETFDQGLRRIGKAVFTSYSPQAFPDFSNTNFIGTSDYLVLQPLASRKKQMICQGDSGSSIFWDQGANSVIAGVTSMQIIEGYDDSYKSWDNCEKSALGLFVPAHQIRQWVDRELRKLDPSYALSTYSSLRGRVTKVTKGKEIDLIKITVEEHLDNGLGLDKESYEFELCKDECEIFPNVTLLPAVKETAYFRVIKDGDKLVVKAIHGTAESKDYKVKFNAIVSGKTSKSTTVDGRLQRGLVFRYMDELDGTKKAPQFELDFGQAIFCESNCGKDSVISTNDFTPAKSRGVTVLAEVIQGQMFITEISANPSYDLDRVEATRERLFSSNIKSVDNSARSCK